MTELQTLIFYIVLCLAPFLFLIMYEFYQMYRYDKELKRIIEELKDYYDQWPGFTEGEQALYQEQTVTVLHKKIMANTKSKLMTRQKLFMIAL